jgi:hypothetical protein
MKDVRKAYRITSEVPKVRYQLKVQNKVTIIYKLNLNTQGQMSVKQAPRNILRPSSGKI